MKDNKFNLQKQRAIQKFKLALNKNEVDNEIVEFLKEFNEKKFYYTSSSCAGRIILLHDLGSKKYSYFVNRWHRKVKVEEVIESLNKFCEKNTTGILWFKQEPLIMHIVAFSLEHAKKVLNIAMKHGLKHSGIIALSEQRYIVEINGNERMSVPLVFNNTLLIEKEALHKYLSLIVEIANKNFEKNEIRRKNFLNDLKEII